MDGGLRTGMGNELEYEGFAPVHILPIVIAREGVEEFVGNGNGLRGTHRFFYQAILRFYTHIPNSALRTLKTYINKSD